MSETSTEKAGQSAEALKATEEAADLFPVKSQEDYMAVLGVIQRLIEQTGVKEAIVVLGDKRKGMGGTVLHGEKPELFLHIEMINKRILKQVMPHAKAKITLGRI